MLYFFNKPVWRKLPAYVRPSDPIPSVAFVFISIPESSHLMPCHFRAHSYGLESGALR